MFASNVTTFSRYLAADLHKYYVVVGGVNGRQEIILPPRRMDMAEWPDWAKKHLRPDDALVIEATTNAWDFYDGALPLVGRVVVANAGRVKLIAQARVKTDQQDVLNLARLLAAGLLPEVWVPPMDVRELRALLAHRRRMVGHRTRLRNRLQSLLHRHGIKAPSQSAFADKHQSWWANLPVSPTERLHLRHDMATLAQLEPQIQEVEVELYRLSTAWPWAEQATYLLQLSGFGLIVTMTMLAAIGDIRRFPGPKQLVGYAGLGASVHDSGLTHRGGRITKSGRRELRAALTEAAWAASEHSSYWKAIYARLCQRMGHNKAIVAIARHLLVAVWHVLTERAADKHGDPKMIAFKLMRWSWKLTDTQRSGLTSRQFIRYHLMRLGLGEDLTHVTYGNMPRRIASVDELLAARPQLQAEFNATES